MADAALKGQRPTASTLTVASGLVVLGISSIVYLVLAARATGPSGFASIAVLWTLLYTLGIGLFVPFEQEVSRAVASRVARGEYPGPVVRRALIAATGLFLLLVVFVMATLPWSWKPLFAESATVVIALLTACAGLALQFVQRGLFAGVGRFRPYAAQMAVEGSFRLVGTGVLIAIGIDSTAAYAVLLGIAPVVSALAVSSTFLPLVLTPGTRAMWRELSTNLLWLLAAALAAQGLANLGTIAIRVLGSPLDTTTTGHFMSGLTLSRLPLFAFAAIQAVLLPRLAHHIARGEYLSFRRQLAVVIFVTAVLGLLAILAAVLVGPQTLQLLFGEDFVFSRADLVWLALSSAIYMLALAFQPAVIALGGHRVNALAWTSGLAFFMVCLVLPMGLYLRVEVALTVGGIVAAALLARYTWSHWHDRPDASIVHDPATGRLGIG